jgi:hypothetical protein
MRGDRGLRPDLATRDDDYAAGKRASEMKDLERATAEYRGRKWQLSSPGRRVSPSA